jgi:hypothetical protein
VNADVQDCPCIEGLAKVVELVKKMPEELS